MKVSLWQLLIFALRSNTSADFDVLPSKKARRDSGSTSTKQTKQTKQTKGKGKGKSGRLEYFQSMPLDVLCEVSLASLSILARRTLTDLRRFVGSLHRSLDTSTLSLFSP